MNSTTARLWDGFVADFIFGKSRLNAPKRRERRAEVHVDAAWLPEGWAFDVVQHQPDVVYISRPDAAGGGCVRLDFRARKWCSEPRGSAAGDSYGGRNWKRRMVKDACTWLEAAPARRARAFGGSQLFVPQNICGTPICCDTLNAMSNSKAAQHVEQGWVPEGWQIEHAKSWPDVVYIERPRDTGGGAVSLDFKLRVWDSGIQCPRRFPSGVDKKQYGGRNWKRQMVEDASKWLEMVMTRNESSGKAAS